jgi:hypothetical protein
MPTTIRSTTISTTAIVGRRLNVERIGAFSGWIGEFTINA